MVGHSPSSVYEVYCPCPSTVRTRLISNNVIDQYFLVQLRAIRQTGEIRRRKSDGLSVQTKWINSGTSRCFGLVTSGRRSRVRMEPRLRHHQIQRRWQLLGASKARHTLEKEIMHSGDYKPISEGENRIFWIIDLFSCACQSRLLDILNVNWIMQTVLCFWRSCLSLCAWDWPRLGGVERVGVGVLCIML